MQTYVILLRGVMPTGKNKVPMAALRAALTKAGLTAVKTYIQSGNVVAQSALDHDALRSLVHNTIQQEIGADIAVVTLTATEMQQILANQPFTDGGHERLYFTVLAAQPDPDRLADLLALDFTPTQIQIIDTIVYILYATKASDSRFTNNFFERKLKVTATTRNFNTMMRLAELSAELLV